MSINIERDRHAAEPGQFVVTDRRGRRLYAGTRDECHEFAQAEIEARAWNASNRD